MRFVYQLTIPAGTAKDAPATNEVKLGKGTINRIEVAFPPGPATLVSVAIRDRKYQIAPANPDGGFSWDDHTYEFNTNYPITDAPYEVILVGWSPDATFQHKVTFHFDLEPAGDVDDKSAWELLFGSGPRPQG